MYTYSTATDGNGTIINGTGGCSGTTNYIQTDQWVGWNTTYMTSGMITGGGNTTWVTWNHAYLEETAEQIAEREERYRENDRIMQLRYEEQRQEATERTRVAMAAAARASELLIELLSDEQRRTWSEHRWFAVRGSASGRTYRIRAGIVNNVDRLSEDGTVRDRVLCAHPTDIPDDDCHLAQMLLLVTDENEFVRIANHHAVAGRDAQLPENLEAYQAARQHDREMNRRAAVEETAEARFHYTLDALQAQVEGVAMEPVVIGVDAFPDARQLDHEVDRTEWLNAYIPPPLRNNDQVFRYNMDVENAVARAYLPGEAI